MLGPSDYCGCIHWDNFTGNDNWLWKDAASGKGLAQIEDRQRIWLGKIDRMSPGDMPAFEPSMVMALSEFSPEPRFDQAHDRDQRRRPFAAEQYDPRPI